MIRAPITPMMNQGIRRGVGGLGSDLRAQVIAALFGNNEQGVWFSGQDSYYTNTGLTAQGALDDTIGGIQDQSGNGLHATQSDLARRSIQRSYGTEYDGVDDFYTMTAAGGAPSDSNTIIAAVKHDPGITDFRYVFAEYTGDKGILLVVRNGQIRPVAAQAGFTAAANGTTDIRGAWHILSVVYDRTNLRLIGRVDGVEEVNIPVEDSDKLTNPENLSYLGFRGIDANTLWDGLIGDFAITNKVLSISDLEFVEQTFADKAGVTLP